VLPDLNKAGVVIVNASQSAQLLQIADEDDPSKMVNDPHFWLDPVIMQQITLNIKDAFVQADPANKAFYEANAASYNAQLEALNKEFSSGLEQYARRKIITSHDAFAYLSQRYNLDNIFIAGLTPEEEPSPQQLAEISEVAKEEGIKYVFFETLVSPRLAEVVAKEAGAQTMVLNPLEGLTDEEIAAGKTYITVMRENLDNLKTALSAQQ
jgi:zinc transport system substrate-binding protein